MKVNTSYIETDILLTLARANERQACEIKTYADQINKIRELIETTADHCIVDNRTFRYANLEIDKVCAIVGLDFEELNAYVEKAKAFQNSDE